MSSERAINRTVSLQHLVKPGSYTTFTYTSPVTCELKKVTVSDRDSFEIGLVQWGDAFSRQILGRGETARISVRNTTDKKRMCVLWLYVAMA